jgi:hypothetical protein
MDWNDERIIRYLDGPRPHAFELTRKIHDELRSQIVWPEPKRRTWWDAIRALLADRP